MSARNKLIAIGLICFLAGVRTGQVQVDDVMIEAFVTSFERLTG